MGNPLEAFSLDELRRRSSIKWQHYPADVLPLWIAEMDVALAEPVVAALRAALDAGDSGYPPDGPRYAEAIAEFAAEVWDWQPDVSATALVPDVMLGIVEVVKLLTGPGGPVVVNSPVYPPFYAFLTAAGRRVLEAPLSPQHRIDLSVLRATFAAAAASGTRAVYLLCSPHNPTGTVHTREELAAVADLAARHGVRVVVDEIHAPLTYPDRRHVPYLSLPGASRAFAVLSATKAWNLAGLKAAVVFAGPDAARELAAMPAEVGHGASHLGVLAHMAAFRRGRPWLAELLAGLADNRQLLADLLAANLAGVRYRQPEGTYLAWLDCRPLRLGQDPAELFLQWGRVALGSGPGFGTGGAGHVRLNLATSREILTEAVRRMAGSVHGCARAGSVG